MDPFNKNINNNNNQFLQEQEYSFYKGIPDFDHKSISHA